MKLCLVFAFVFVVRKHVQPTGLIYPTPPLWHKCQGRDLALCVGMRLPISPENFERRLTEIILKSTSAMQQQRFSTLRGFAAIQTHEPLYQKSFCDFIPGKFPFLLRAVLLTEGTIGTWFSMETVSTPRKQEDKKEKKWRASLLGIFATMAIGVVPLQSWAQWVSTG